jgi:hypothetical protein
MAVNVGELVATMRLNDQDFVSGLNQAPARARDALGRFVSASGEAGTQAGNALGQGAANATQQSTRGFFGRLGHDLGDEFIGGIKKMIAAAGVIAGGKAILGFFKDSIDAASDLNETVSKAGTIFGSNFGKIQQWASTAAESLGLSTQAAMSSAAAFGDMFLQLGIGEDTAADMSTQVVQLAADLGSFSNLETADVVDRMSGAFRGEYDSLQAVIPNISAARVETEALAMTHKSSVSELTAAEKATAVLAIVQKDGARAMGDFAKTSEGAANTQKILAARFEDTKAAVGEKLMPAWQAFLQVLSAGLTIFNGVIDMVGGLVTWFSQLPGPVQAGAIAFVAWVTIGPQVIGFLRGLLFVIPLIMSSVGGMAAGMRAAGAAMLSAFGGPIGVAILAVTAAVGFFMSKTEQATPTTISFADAVDQATGRLKENAQATIQAAAAEGGHIDAMKAVNVAADTYSSALAGNKADLDAVHTAILDAATAAVQNSDAWGRMSARGETAGKSARDVASGLLASGDAGRFAGEGMDSALMASSTLATDMSTLDTESRRAAQSTESAGKGAAAAGAGAESATTPMENLKTATQQLDAAASAADTATQFLTASLNAMNGGALSAEQASNLAAAAMRGVGAAQREQQASSDGLLSAQIAVSDATTHLADVTSHLGDENVETRTTAQDQMEAQLSLNDANRGLVQATDDVAAANEGLSKANLTARDAAVKNAASAFTLAGGFDNLDGATAAATAKIEEARAAFIRTQPQADILSGKADATARSLFGIPGDVNTFIREAGAANVQSQAANTAGAIGRIPDSHNTNITVSGISQLDVALGRLNAIQQIPGYKQLVVETIARGQNIPTPHLGGAMHRGGTAFAGGGAAPDYGAWQSDTIPGLWHRGEHVLDAQDVTRMGGQAAVYGFRDALSAGGPVDAAMRILAANGGLPGASAPPAITGGAQTQPGRQIQFTGPITVGKFDDARDLINHAILAAL